MRLHQPQEPELVKELKQIIVTSQNERELVDNLYEFITRREAKAVSDATHKALGFEDMSFPDGPIEYGGEG